MRDSNSGSEDRGNMERLGESAGAMAGRAADFGMEVTGALFRSAAEMLGGWWSSDAPRQAASAWTDQAERSCRTHFQSNGRSSGSTAGMQASGSAAGAAGSMSASGTTGGAGQTGAVTPKSQHASMQSAGEIATDTGGSGSGVAFDATAKVGDTKVSGSAHASGASLEGSMSMDRASDGFEHARPGYQLGYVARSNPAYRGRSFSEIEPELQRVWESRAKTEGGSSASSSTWPEVRGFVDFAYQQGE